MDRVIKKLDHLVDGSTTAAQILVTHKGETVLNESFGCINWEGIDRPVTADTPFLVASITKPVTATAMMCCVECSLIDIEDPIRKYVPEFTGKGREDVTVCDLLRHTSGLPDMLPNNESLRRRNASPEEFVKRTIATAPLFDPGSAFHYQSMGVNLAGEIIERVTGTPLRVFMAHEIFEPLGMEQTSLGMGGRPLTDLAPCDVEVKSGDEDFDRWDWNSRYWRDFGAPWGGLHSTATDLTAFLRSFINIENTENKKILKEGTVVEMTTDQIAFSDAAWGLGWGFKDSPAWTYFGEYVSAATFGHSGATGTLAWADPERDLTFVCLTTQPICEHEDGFFDELSDDVIKALES